LTNSEQFCIFVVAVVEKVTLSQIDEDQFKVYNDI